MSEENKVIGFLDEVTDEAIYGWAISSNVKRPLSVRLMIDEKEIASTETAVYREDLHNAGIHDTGYCGFFFDLKEKGIELQQNCVVRIVVGQEAIDLTNSPWFYYNDQYLKKIDKETQSLEFGESDKKILIVGLAKSGTSILTYSISSMLDEPKVYFEPHTTQCLNHIEFHRNIRQENQVVTKALYYPNYPHRLSLISAYYNKKIIITRDPRDLLLSTFFYSWNRTDNPPINKFESTLKLVIEKEKNPDLVSFSSILETRPEIKKRVLGSTSEICDIIKDLGDDWFIIKYEDFIQGGVEKLNDYLSFSLNMQAAVPNELKRVERTKKFDNWRRWFNQEDVQILVPELSSYLTQLGYDANDWELTRQGTLPSQEGSDYMKKLFLQISQKETASSKSKFHVIKEMLAQMKAKFVGRNIE